MKVEHIISLFAATASALPFTPRALAIPDYPGLYFSNGQFQISMFNDLHLGDQGYQKWTPTKKGPWSDAATIDVMNTVLDLEPNVQLGVLNGDLLACDWLAQNDAYSFLDKAMSPFFKRNLPFTTTWGNHDWSTSCNTQWMQEYMWTAANKNGNRLTWTANSSIPGGQDNIGTSNYYIPLYSKTDNGNQKLKMILWFFDSRGGWAYRADGTKHGAGGFVHPNFNCTNSGVFEIYVNKKTRSQRMRDQLQKGRGDVPIPSLVFVHIPLPIVEQYRQYWINTNSHSESAFPGIIDREDPGVQDNINLMQALHDTPGLLGVFSGHDHESDWCLKWTDTPTPIPYGWPRSANGYGLNLCFGRHTGYGGYGNLLRGGRQIVINEHNLGGDNAIETWIRLEDGHESGRVMLNMTYGKDNYAPAIDTNSTLGGTMPYSGPGKDDEGKFLSTTTRKNSSSTGRKISTTTKTTKATKATTTAKSKPAKRGTRAISKKAEPTIKAPKTTEVKSTSKYGSTTRSRP